MIGGYSPEAAEKPLRLYQTFAVEWLLDRLYDREWPGAGLFLDPGLGKTRISLTLLDVLFNLGHIRRVLVVAPLRPIYTVWPAEIKRWGFPFKSIILHRQHASAMAYNYPVELVNFEGLVKLKDISQRWDMMLVDESTFVKNWSAKRTKAMRAMVKNIPQTVILTGTPAANSLHDLHAQHFMIDRGERLGKTVGAFRSQFCRQGGWYGRKWIVRSGIKDALLDAVKDTCLRMEAKDHLDMPELIQHEIWCKMPDSALIQYKRLKRELFAELQTGDVIAGNAAAAYTKCKQFANGQVYSTNDQGEREVHTAHKEKLSALEELLEELAGKPLLTFYHFSHDRDSILQLPAFKNAPVISGGMKVDEVEDIIKRWNAGKIRVLLAQWQAASHGLNMQERCNDIACFGLHDSLEIYDQAIRRVYRQGVTGAQVRIHRILTMGTVEQVMVERLEGKTKTQSEFLDALKQHAKG